MPMDQSCSWGRAEEGPRVATSWRSPPDPTDGEDQIVAPALEPMSGSGMPERPLAKRGTCLKIC